jgi:hypothetical protein
MSYLFLDDLRNPDNNQWYVVRSYNEFVDYILSHDIPTVVSMDHDLGLEKDGYDCIKFLVHYIIDNYMSKCKEVTLPVVMVHSMNPVGRANIEKYWESFVLSVLSDRI